MATTKVNYVRVNGENTLKAWQKENGDFDDYTPAPVSKKSKNVKTRKGQVWVHATPEDDKHCWTANSLDLAQQAKIIRQKNAEGEDAEVGEVVVKIEHPDSIGREGGLMVS